MILTDYLTLKCSTRDVSVSSQSRVWVDVDQTPTGSLLYYYVELLLLGLEHKGLLSCKQGQEMWMKRNRRGGVYWRYMYCSHVERWGRSAGTDVGRSPLSLTLTRKSCFLRKHAVYNKPLHFTGKGAWPQQRESFPTNTALGMHTGDDGSGHWYRSSS